MDKWEYQTRFYYANANDPEIKDYLSNLYPGWNPAKYSPEAMEKSFNEKGEEGWELIHIQPVAGVGSNADIWWQGGATPKYSNAYFCIFKRRKPQ